MDELKLFLCGDVMTGRGIDQALPNPGDPGLHEPNVKDARRYLELAERANGPITRPMDYEDVWGIVPEELRKRSPDYRIINLETSITDSDEFWDGKGIHYRMNPDNVSVLTQLEVDLCVLSNNHVLDFGPAGLIETLRVLRDENVKTTGAGRHRKQARQPATFNLGNDHRLLVFGVATSSAGVPAPWQADERSPGVFYLDDISEASAREVADHINTFKRPNDRVVLSIHWGGNWGYEIPDHHRQFAHALIDSETVDLVHGHSSHHVKGFELHRNRLILYGCGDFLTDYEGIRGHERFRDDLGLMYYPRLNVTSGHLNDLVMVPTHLRNVSLQRPDGEDLNHLENTLRRELSQFGLDITRTNRETFRLHQ